MPVNSTILANLQLQIQDNLNPGSTPVNRFVPQFSYGEPMASAYQAYLVCQPNVVTQIQLGNMGFLFVRNASVNPQAVFTLIFKDSVSNVINNITMSPGGIFLVGNPPLPLGSFVNAQVSIAVTGLACTVEFMWAF